MQAIALTRTYKAEHRWTPSGDAGDDDDDLAGGDIDDDIVDDDDDSADHHQPREVLALDRVDLVVERGSMIGLLGDAGAGKTTLVRLIAGTLRPTSGVVLTAGRVAPPPAAIASLLEPRRSGRKNLVSMADFLDVRREVVSERAEAIFAAAGLTGAEDRVVREYGKDANVALAFSALVHMPVDLYLFDGVPKFADAHVRERLDTLLRERLAAGAAVIMTARRDTQLPSGTDSVAVLEAGRLVSNEPVRTEPEAESQDAFRERFVGESPALRVGEIEVEMLSTAATTLVVPVERLSDDASLIVGIALRGGGRPAAKFTRTLEPGAPSSELIAVTLPSQPDVSGPHRIHVSVLVRQGSREHVVAAPSPVVVKLPKSSPTGRSSDPTWEVRPFPGRDAHSEQTL
jgi:ABC-type polysaccharide/polyol phosphate transport system ATPase subunit